MGQIILLVASRHQRLAATTIFNLTVHLIREQLQVVQNGAPNPPANLPEDVHPALSQTAQQNGA